MFWIVQSILLSFSLAMDATAVSMTNGLVEPQMKKKKMLLIAAMFGIFQGIMPLIGYLCGSIFEKWIANVVPIIGFIILSFIGGKMIYEAIKHGDEEKKDLTLKVILIQAVATSIDALTVGIVYVGSPQVEVFTTFLLIAVITFICCIFAILIGRKFGDKLSNKAEILGGIILICIALKILIEFLINVL
ncbi:MAG: manganese efflux pump [Erysipelotrichaceae bacterium]|nr:manganese efflux pump [Erysipelotrichaceae bacterium]